MTKQKDFNPFHDDFSHHPLTYKYLNQDNRHHIISSCDTAISDMKYLKAHFSRNRLDNSGQLIMLPITEAILNCYGDGKAKWVMRTILANNDCWDTDYKKGSSFSTLEGICFALYTNYKILENIFLTGNTEDRDCINKKPLQDYCTWVRLLLEVYPYIEPRSLFDVDYGNSLRYCKKITDFKEALKEVDLGLYDKFKFNLD